MTTYLPPPHHQKWKAYDPSLRKWFFVITTADRTSQSLTLLNQMAWLVPVDQDVKDRRRFTHNVAGRVPTEPLHSVDPNPAIPTIVRALRHWTQKRSASYRHTVMFLLHRHPHAIRGLNLFHEPQSYAQQTLQMSLKYPSSLRFLIVLQLPSRCRHAQLALYLMGPQDNRLALHNLPRGNNRGGAVT